MCLTQGTRGAHSQLFRIRGRLANATFNVAEIHYKTALRTGQMLSIHSPRDATTKSRARPIARAFVQPQSGGSQ